MNKRRRVLFIVYWSILVLLGLGFFLLNNHVTKASMPITILDNQQNSINTAKTAYITISSSKQWREADSSVGAQFDGVFYNTGNYPLTDWVMNITLPSGSKIDSSWNFLYSLSDDKMVATCMDYNEIIPARDSITFGFILISKAEAELDEIEMTVSPVIHITDYPLFWVLVALTITYILSISVSIILDINLSKYRKQRIKDQNIIIQSMKTFSNFIDAKDPYTNGHSVRVAYYSRELAKKLGLSLAEIEKLYYIALLHDVGKISVPDAVLNKPGPLDPEERKMIEKHTIVGGQMLKDFTAISGIREGALYHHEHYDGGGYPEGLKGEAIPLYARIICVADAYDAMSSDRCYRSKLTTNRIIEELSVNAGVQFDSEIVTCMLELMRSPSFPNFDEEKVKKQKKHRLQFTK